MAEKRIHSNILCITRSSQRKTCSDKGARIENFGTNCSRISSTNNTLITDIFILLALCVPKVWWFYIQPHNSLCRSSVTFTWMWFEILTDKVWGYKIPMFCDHYQWKEILYFYFAHTNRCGYGQAPMRGGYITWQLASRGQWFHSPLSQPTLGFTCVCPQCDNG